MLREVLIYVYLHSLWWPLRMDYTSMLIGSYLVDNMLNACLVTTIEFNNGRREVNLNTDWNLPRQRIFAVRLLPMAFCVVKMRPLDGSGSRALQAEQWSQTRRSSALTEDLTKSCPVFSTVALGVQKFYRKLTDPTMLRLRVFERYSPNMEQNDV